MKGYYRPDKTNPNWYGIFTEQIEVGEPPEEVLDNLCELACGIRLGGASDACMRYATHIHAHLMAAFKVGQATRLLQEAEKEEHAQRNR